MNNKKKVLAITGFVMVLCLLLTPGAFAQSTATVTGTVTDATGAVVPNATVTVRNQNTGEERATQTDSAGVIWSRPAGSASTASK